MCTLIINRQPSHPWPVLIAENRDEMKNRASLLPGAHWVERPWVLAGKDILAGGAWQGINRYGLVVTILNRANSLGPQQGKRSRGELVLEMLDHASAEEAAQACADLNPQAYRPFNLILADSTDAIWVKHDDTGPISLFDIPEGTSMISNGDLNDGINQQKLRKYLPKFRIAERPNIDQEDWSSWTDLLTKEAPFNEVEHLNVQTSSGFQTVSSSLIALPQKALQTTPKFLYADFTSPSKTYQEVDVLFPITAEDE